jgi:hypothetical protein
MFLYLVRSTPEAVPRLQGWVDEFNQESCPVNAWAHTWACLGVRWTGDAQSSSSGAPPRSPRHHNCQNQPLRIPLENAVGNSDHKKESLWAPKIPSASNLLSPASHCFGSPASSLRYYLDLISANDAQRPPCSSSHSPLAQGVVRGVATPIQGGCDSLTRKSRPPCQEGPKS